MSRRPWEIPHISAVLPEIIDRRFRSAPAANSAFTMSRLPVKAAAYSALALQQGWLTSAFAASSVQLTLMVAPEFQGEYDEALINLAARRFSLRSAISLEHPTDDLTTTAVLQRYNFHAQRTLIHMHTE